jgi:hypothetical protein
MKNAGFWDAALCCGLTDVSEECIASIYPKDRGDTFLQNVGSTKKIYPEDGGDKFPRNVGSTKIREDGVLQTSKAKNGEI